MEQLTPTEPNRLQLLAVIGEAFAIAGSATSVALTAAARTLADHFGDGCGLQLFDDPQPFGGWHRDAELGAQIHVALAARNRPGFDGLSGRVARTGYGIRIARTTPPELHPFTPPELGAALSRCGVHSAMVLPMRVPGRTIGVLTALRDRTPQGYSAAEQEFLQELADYVALAVTTVQLASSQRQLDRLTERDRLQREAVAGMSHDLRTPLAAIHVALGLLVVSAMDQLDVASAELLFTAQRNTQRLVIMIEDLLTLNQLDAGVLELRIMPLDLRAAVDEAVRVTSPLFLEKDQEVTVALPASLPAVGDARRIEQVVTNVLANAHRHTHPGARIEIAGTVTETEIVLTISDDGRGIPPHLLERIFDRHHRRNAGGGSGIGLATARALMVRHGGRLWAENGPRGGAVFFIALPAHDVRQ